MVLSNIITNFVAIGMLIFSVYVGFSENKKLSANHPSCQPYIFGYFNGTILILGSILAILFLLTFISGVFDSNILIAIIQLMSLTKDALTMISIALIDLIGGLGILLRKKWGWIIWLGNFLASLIKSFIDIYREPIQNIPELAEILGGIIVSGVIFICITIYFLKRRKELSWI